VKRKVGVADLPLHGGRAPPWLMERMIRLARAIILVMREDYPPELILRRLSDPFWFQSFGCILGFDWHSSGVTTTVCGALKKGLEGLEKEIGFVVAGGKGKTSRKTPQELCDYGLKTGAPADILIKASKLTAKVDSSCVQDGYELYHHSFFATVDGKWAVVQQGMNNNNGYARRYHWLSESLQDFTSEPHQAVCCDQRGEALNLVAQEAESNRKASVEIAAQGGLFMESKLIKLKMPAHHPVKLNPESSNRLGRILDRLQQNPPSDFEDLLIQPGVGSRTLLALALTAELVHGAPASWRDPAHYSFAHGGKDGHPFPVDRTTYETTISTLEKSLDRSKIEFSDKRRALQRLAEWTKQFDLPLK
jgi:hypothetical protein